MEFHVNLRSKDSDGKFSFTSRVCALDGLAKTRAAIGIDVPSTCVSDLIKSFNEDYLRKISEAEALAFGGFENIHCRRIFVDGFIQKYRKITYDIKREKGTDAITSVTPAFYLDFDALFEDWKAAGCPDTLTITED